MAHFNRERVPERNVHAKGSGAFGTFETTEDVSQYTKAALFQPGVHDGDAGPVLDASPASRAAPTPGATHAASRSKFYTTEGNYDLVGNNTPIFFIRDTMKFPHFIRTQKRMRRLGPARQPHAVGLLDAEPGVRSPGHLPDGRPRHPRDRSAT